MLVLTRRSGESIVIGNGIKLTVVSVGPGPPLATGGHPGPLSGDPLRDSTRPRGAGMYAVALAPLTVGADAPEPANPVLPPASPKEALQPFKDLIGSWKGSGAPEGTREE